MIGRKKDIIIVAGNNVYPEDVEDAVGKVLGIIQAASLPLPSRTWVLEVNRSR